ncbi:right-handed parallel beta-helix repeat-containing protein [Amycolatopsis rhabdoformis]|uniref:Right-handed parallel beta-helix repeat-containing protein n=1 Tax=Amycolatopsis rhabdoformis TaxID=1448059 RepID=A0ABZ1I3Q4_9PSEU|nr:right-handed parallel beta-helix repeat-containing protein [Amycolatopsis rhabdoformis]WSE29022.1 right-handed parallel beta-helix repeat-containing protein [Amycolatopsis rhabdoformis]
MGRSAAVVAGLVLVTSALSGAAAGASTGAGPAAVCGTTVTEYSSAPTGAVVVEPGHDLGALTQASPAGTTFWLKPGTHTLGTDAYGQVQPKDGDTYLGAPGAVLDGQNVNQAAFTGQAKDVTIRGLTVRGFAAPQDQGVVNHDSGTHWVIEDSTIEDNRGAALMAGDKQEVRRSCLKDNGQYGMNAYRAGDGITGLVLEGNEITGNNTDDWETKSPGCGCSGGVKFWAVNGADVTGNWVHGNHGPGLWADTNDNDFLVQDNVIEDNDAEALFYEISHNLTVRDNVFRRNALVAGRAKAAKGDNFPVAAIYLSESGGEPRLAARTHQIDIGGNTFEDNWGGVALWENADRFCNSPANTSTGYCTPFATKAQCSAPAITQKPLYDDCRWKTQNVTVHDNTFTFDPAHLGCTQFCGRMAVLSNYGSYPDWSPYKGDVVQQAITFAQDNHFTNNTYSGPWAFVAHDTSRVLTPEQWQAGPYGQDEGSKF